QHGLRRVISERRVVDDLSTRIERQDVEQSDPGALGDALDLLHQIGGVAPTRLEPHRRAVQYLLPGEAGSSAHRVLVVRDRSNDQLACGTAVLPTTLTRRSGQLDVRNAQVLHASPQLATM